MESFESSKDIKDPSWMNDQSTGKNERDIRRRKTETGGIFGKKFATTSRFVVSSQVWMSTIPTRDCDVLMTFPAKTDDHTLMWVLARLRSRTPELAVHVRHHSSTGVYGYYLTASYSNLLKGAEILGLKKPLKHEYGGGMKEFDYEDRGYFEGFEDEHTFLTSQERQIIVRHMLFNLRAVYGDELGKIKFLEGQAIIPILISRKVIKQVLPLHNNENLHELKQTWMAAFFKKQPLDKICDYFGVKIAMYFAYLGHYTLALIWPALVGSLLWLMSGKDQVFDDYCFILFAIVNIAWATLYLEHWKRRSSELAYCWGTLDQGPDLLVEARPLYTGTLQTSPITGRQEFYYPAWKRNLFRYFVSFPIIIFCLFIVFLVMLLILNIEDGLLKKIKAGEYPFIAKFAPKILMAISISILDDIYKRIANWLNHMENYRNDQSYETHLVIKLVLFQFVNSFLSLFYIGFYLRDMTRLKEQLAAIFITRQIIGNIKEALVPYIIEKVKLIRVGYKMTAHMSPDTLAREMRDIMERSDSRERDDSPEEEVEHPALQDIPLPDAIPHATKPTHNGNGPILTQAEVEAAMKRYEDTFEDYLEMFIQFGYVTLFSSAFPLAALCALLNNIIEIRSDAFKLCMTFQRPFGQRVENIGIWQDCLELLGVVAVIVNCALMGMSGTVHRFFPDWGATEILLLIVALEHIILVIRCGIAYAIPDIPHWVATEMARWEFGRREALKRLQSRSPEWVKTPSGPTPGNSASDNDFESSHNST